jgi:hypothetical protein
MVARLVLGWKAGAMDIEAEIRVANTPLMLESRRLRDSVHQIFQKAQRLHQQHDAVPNTYHQAFLLDQAALQLESAMWGAMRGGSLYAAQGGLEIADTVHDGCKLLLEALRKVHANAVAVGTSLPG